MFSKKLLIVLSLIIMSAGCSSHINGVVSNTQKVAYPGMNTKETAKKGQNIAVQVYSYNTESVRLFKPYNNKLEKGQYMLYGTYGKNNGKKIFKLQDSKQKEFIIIDKDEMAYYGFANGYGAVIKGRQLDRGSYIYDKKEEVALKFKPKQTLVYNGKKGNNVYLTYNETVDDKTVSKNLTFNIRKNKVISHKGMRIQIVNAEPSYITYIKLSEFE